MFFKWRLRVGDDGLFRVSDKEMQGTGREVPLNITGPHRPDMPTKPFTEPEYLRWKADLMTNGFTVDDRLLGM